MKHILLIAGLMGALNGALFSQSTLILQPGPADGKDAEIWSLKPYEVYENDLVRALGWTFQGTYGIVRGFMEFDLTSVPAGSAIDSAFLFLYAPDPPNMQFHSGENAAYLRRITSGWEEDYVSWNNQPMTTNSNQVTLPKSSAEYQDYLHINVTALVRDMVHDPLHSFGLMLLLQDESKYHRISFCSSDYPDETKHPKLVIHYSPSTCASLVLQPGEDGKDCEVFSLQPDHNFVGYTFRGLSWTFQGSKGDIRGLIDFDMSSLPQNAIIEEAYLSLFSPDPPTTEFHSGSNTALLQRITSPWEETEVTWNNQPTTTTDHQVTLEASLNDYQDYVNIDVTQLVNDMHTDAQNNYGFMLRQVTEEPYRRLAFCTGDYANPKKHPKLEICYKTPGIEPEPSEITDILFFPNPCSDWMKIKMNKIVPLVRVQIIDVLGRILFDEDIDPALPIDMSYLPAALYVVRCLGSSDEVLGKAKMIKIQL